jgi:protein phosphatase
MTDPTTETVAGRDVSAGQDVVAGQDAGAGGDRMPREIELPALSLVVLVGATGSGKSTFARAHFAPTEVLSSDHCRALVSDDENDQSATSDAFDVLHYIAGKRLAAGRLTVVDATNVQVEARRPLIALAREHDVLPVAIVLDIPEPECARRNADRPDRAFGPHVLRRQRDQLRRGLKSLAREGFRAVHVLRGTDDVDRVRITRTPLFNDRRELAGPFDVVGDVHGCLDELLALLTELGYEIACDADGLPVDAVHPEGRLAVFLGDLVDRGPDTPGVLRLVMGMVAAGKALCVAGNHEVKLLRALRGKQVRVSHGLAESLEQLAAASPEFRTRVERFIDGLISHYALDGGRLVVSHAGLPERLQGRASGRVRQFCLYGETTGETDEYGLPVRYPWAQDYRGAATVLYGHTPVPRTEWLNNTLCLDTGCVFGGRLTALRYPERELVSVPAARVYVESLKPLSDTGSAPAEGLVAAPAGSAPARSGFAGVATVEGTESSRRDGGVLDLTDVLGDRGVQTRLQGRVGVREGNAAAALEVMSRFAIDPRWLLYLPPTMSPVATSTRDGLLEHPDQAFQVYLADGVGDVVCEEKHMGSRAVALVCRDLDAARSAFGAPGDVAGAVWTRTGRPFFDPATTAVLVERLAAAVERAGLFEELDASWLLLDAELLPWNAKALDLLRRRRCRGPGRPAVRGRPAGAGSRDRAGRR